jgi:Domain of unknown function (DUF4398)
VFFCSYGTVENGSNLSRAILEGHSFENFKVELMSGIFDTDRGLTFRWKAPFRIYLFPSLIILLALENSGCSAAKPPADTLAKAELSLRAAGEARADELAPMDLQSAREKLEGSKQAMAAKKYEEARRLAESAQVEAELAETKAEAEIMRRAVRELRTSIDVLKLEGELGSRKSLSRGPDRE